MVAIDRAELVRLLDAPLQPHGSHTGSRMAGCLACLLRAISEEITYTATAPVTATPGPSTPEGATPMTVQRVPAPCGTRAAYVRHIRRGEHVDDACRAANTAYNREYREIRDRLVPRPAQGEARRG